MTSPYIKEAVLDVRHWTDQYFSFTVARDDGFRFDNGQFVMIGLEVDGMPLVRAYSIASANWEEHLEFFSIKVPNGPLTSRLKHIQPGDCLLISRKPTGTLLISDVHPGKVLYLLSTGTGLAPFLAIIKDPETYERFEHVVVVHGVRYAKDLAYTDYFKNELPRHEYLGEQISRQLHYVPVVSREPFALYGRATTLLENGEIPRFLGFPGLNPETDRAMICGSPAMLGDISKLLDARGFVISPHTGVAGDYVIERAFVEK